MIERFEDLGDAIKQKIIPYQKLSTKSNDKLNEVQGAYIRYCASELNRTGERMSPVKLDHIIRTGMDERLFASDNPKDLTTYLQHRLKNEKKSIRCKEVVVNSQGRLSDFLNEELNNCDSV